MSKTVFRSIMLFLFLFGAGAVSTTKAADSFRPRLVSLAPSITEMIFAIDAEKFLVGVTDHCRFPPEANAIAKVGGYQSPNYEAIMALRPDLVLTLAEHSPSHSALDALGVKYVVMDHRSLPGLLASFETLGKICGALERALELRDQLEAALASPAGYDPEDAPSLLFVIGRDYGLGAIANAYVVGHDRLYENLIAAVGCRNAYKGDLAYPVLAAEGVAAMDPDIIIEGIYAEMGTAMGEGELLKDWQTLANLRAVISGNILYIRADYIYIPGMRMALLKRDLAEAVAKTGLTRSERP